MAARLLLGTLVALLLTISGLNVVNSYVGRDFMTAVEHRDMAGFIRMAALYAGVLVLSTLVAVMYRAFAGRELEVNQEVYKSESETNQRDQAIAMLMFAYGLIKENPARATDLYTRQCSIDVDARDLAVMAATLANGGRNPVTKKQIVDRRHVPGILAVMATAGLYDDSGKWLFATGLPAKSGVGGGIIAVSPGRFGIAAFSPPLDAAGNSVRAQKAIRDVSDTLGGNLSRHARVTENRNDGDVIRFQVGVVYSVFD
jgi:glutaminase